MIASSLRRAFGQSQLFPTEYRRNFLLLYLDVVFFGILNGSTVVFLAIYASRLGATVTQIGFLTASPALMNILFSFAASNFARGKSPYRITRWAWLITRIFYALLIPLPLLLPPQTQIWVIIAITLAMNLPGTAAAVIGNAFFADAVPLRFRGSVVGTRNALLALTTTLTSLSVGGVLKVFSFSQGYAIVFAMGFIGSMASVVMLFLIKPVKDPDIQNDPVQTHQPSHVAGGIRPEILRTPFGRVVLTVFLYQTAVFFANPIYPLYQVNSLRLSDQIISQGTSLFWVIFFLGSTQGGVLARRWGFRKVFGIGTLGSGLALLVLTFATHTWIYMLGQLVSGSAWALISCGLINYVLERVPADDRPAYLAWYNTAVNAAILLCGLFVPVLLGMNGISGASPASLFGGLLLGTLFRFMGGAFILLWG
jgi:MFS family permease